MSRLNKAEEIIELAILMQNSYLGLTIDEIAEKFECSRRSAERMKALLFEKFPDKIEEVFHSSDRKKRWRLKKGTMNFLINFTSSDFANLEYCKNLIKNSTKQKEFSELIEKIKALNPVIYFDNDIDMLLESQGFVVRQQFKENIKPEILEIIKEAILSQKQIVISYKNHKEKNIVLNPYGILIADRQYLVAFNEYYKKIYMYRLNLINEIELSDDYFEKDENFDLKKYVNQSFGIYQGTVYDVKLEFDSSVRDDVLEYYFHPTQKIEELKNGNIVVTFCASGDYAIISEILKWLDCVKIIAPESLKKEYQETIFRMYNNVITS